MERDKTDAQVFNEALNAWLVERKRLRKQSKKSGPERSTWVLQRVTSANGCIGDTETTILLEWKP
jgi:hypothetical protein